MGTQERFGNGSASGYGTNFARSERHGLADLLDEVGPDASTLCEGWRAADLAAHLIVRESSLLPAAGILLPPLAERAQGAMDRLVSQTPYATLVDRVRNGPPRLSPFRSDRADRAINTVEFFVHHEDLRRARPDWQPRTLSPQLEDELWHRVRLMGRVLFRRVATGVMLAHPDGLLARVRSGEPTAIVSGPPAELLLYGSGRREVARVELSGPDPALEALRHARLAF